MGKSKSINLCKCVLLIGFCILSITGCASDENIKQDKVIYTSEKSNSQGINDTKIVVDVAGYVKHPGVYELKEGSRVHQAISAAGGVKSGAILTSVNRAAKAVDGQQIIIPGPTANSSISASSQAIGVSKVSINSADAIELEKLPGIGPTTAQNIVDDRTANGPFSSIDDLDRVAGIGAGIISKLESSATL